MVNVSAEGKQFLHHGLPTLPTSRLVAGHVTPFHPIARHIADTRRYGSKQNERLSLAHCGR
jgi:hypothetical protein